MRNRTYAPLYLQQAISKQSVPPAISTCSPVAAVISAVLPGLGPPVVAVFRRAIVPQGAPYDALVVVPAGLIQIHGRWCSESGTVC